MESRLKVLKGDKRAICTTVGKARAAVDRLNARHETAPCGADF